MASQRKFDEDKEYFCLETQGDQKGILTLRYLAESLTGVVFRVLAPDKQTRKFMFIDYQTPFDIFETEEVAKIELELLHKREEERRKKRLEDMVLNMEVFCKEALVTTGDLEDRIAELESQRISKVRGWLNFIKENYHAKKSK